MYVSAVREGPRTYLSNVFGCCGGMHYVMEIFVLEAQSGGIVVNPGDVAVGLVLETSLAEVR